MTYYDQRKDEKLRVSYDSTVVFILLCGCLLITLSLFFFKDILKLSFISSDTMWLYISIIVLSMFSQTMVFLLKASEVVHKVVKVYLLINCVLILNSIFFVINFKYSGAIFSLFSFYFMSTLISTFTLYSYWKSSLSTIFTHTPFDLRFREYLVPNYIESLFSVPRNWLSVYILISMVGFAIVGEVMLVQMILGLFSFFNQSLIMNEYNKIDVTCKNKQLQWVVSLNKKIDILILSFIAIILITWDLTKNILNINTLTDYSIVFLISASIVQVKILPIGMLIKRLGKAKLSLKHNILFTTILLSSNLFFIYFFGSSGFAFSFLFSWSATLLYILMDIKRLCIINPRSLILNYTAIILILPVLYFIIRFD